MDLIGRGTRTQRTPQAARLATALKAFREAVQKAEGSSYHMESRVVAPEDQGRYLHAVVSSAQALLPLLDIEFESQSRMQSLSKYFTRARNLKKIVARMAACTTWEALADAIGDERTKSKYAYEKIAEYAREVVDLVEYEEDEIVDGFSQDGWSISLVEKQNASWDPEGIDRLKQLVARGTDILRAGGFGRAVGGNIYAYPLSTLPHSSAAVARYSPRSDAVEVAVEAADTEKMVVSFVHEVGHRVYFRTIGNRGREAWAAFFESQIGHPADVVDTLLRRWEDFHADALARAARNEARAWEDAEHGAETRFFARYLKQADTALYDWFLLLVDRLALLEPLDPRTDRLKKGAKSGLEIFRERKDDAKVFLHPVTPYSATNPEELFAETFAHYLVKGPSRIPEIVRQAFRDATGSWLRAASQPLRLTRDYGSEEVSDVAVRVARRYLG